MAVSCAPSVNQDAHTGDDGKVKGAKPMTLDQNEAKTKGIVTYPGGDRVDWKELDLPDKQHGALDIKLAWTPPRPGLQLGMDVFDEWGTQIAGTKKKGRKSRSRSRELNVASAKGKVFIRVYAVNPGDAGTYKLVVDFTPAIDLDLSKVDISDPPRLPAVPEADCTDLTFDVKNPSCTAICPTSGPPPPPGWPGCQGKCPNPPDVSNQACWATMPCPNPPKREVKACTKSMFPPCPDKSNPDPNNPNCDGPLPPTYAQVYSTQVQGNSTIITISVGQDHKIDRSWTGQLLRGDSDQPVSNGAITIIRVEKQTTVGRVELPVDTVSANPRVKLIPPPRQ